MGSRRIGGMLLVLGLAACTPSYRLVPASGVERATARPGAALVRGSGVTLIADPTLRPSDAKLLERGITALYVRIVNDSDEPIAVRYLSFLLMSDLGDERRPLPPFAIERARPVESAVAPSVDALRFRYAPYYADLVGDSTRCWTGGMALDPYYYETFLRWPADLPSALMVRRALPEGVLEPGGSIAGYLYFESLGPEVRRVVLEAELDRPLGDERVATIAIPFVGSRS